MPVTSTESDRYLLHLNRALALENALSEHLEERIASASDAPFKQRLKQFREEHQQHREALREFITSLRGEPTAAKVVLQHPIAAGMAAKLLERLESEKEERALNGQLTGLAAEHYAAAVYLVLALAARQLNHGSHATRFDTIRQQKRDLAEFLASHLSEPVRTAFPATRAA